jgi:hypothetical protein
MNAEDCGDFLVGDFTALLCSIDKFAEHQMILLRATVL